ncbi:hypothetical protein AB7952_33425 [Streptomyces sp. PG2]
MPTTLGELYDTAGHHLRVAAAAPPLPGDVQEQAVVLRLLDELLGHVQSTLESAGERPRRLNPGPATPLAVARNALRRMARRLPAPAPTPPDSAGLYDAPLGRAVQAAAVVRDLLAGHHGQDGAPLTPYALAFTERSARAYLVHRSADLAGGAAHVVRALGRAATGEAAAVQLHLARTNLDHAFVSGRAAGEHRNPALAAFPLALPLAPRPALPTDPAGSLSAHLSDDCERLSRAAFEALHGRGERALSGSDIGQMARWLAMGNLLSGRLLLHVAAHADAETAEGLREAADRLRTAAQAWQHSASRWHRIVDLADPRAHPTLPLPDYQLVRSGRFTPMPRTPPHSALLVARASTTRLGQLLYGTDWTPETPKPRSEQRDALAILADTGGLAGLTQTLYRTTATGWQLAAAMPVTVRRIESTLVTDNIDHRPADATHRFYPLPGHQARRLAEHYEKVTEAEQAAAASLVRTAPRTGMDTARARLDMAAHRHIRSGQPWLPLETPAPRGTETERPSARAARARSTTVARTALGSAGGDAQPPHLREARGPQLPRRSHGR